MSEHWLDAVDLYPILICDVMLKDGTTVEARCVMGNFETHDGRVLYPERFVVKEIRIIQWLSDAPGWMKK